MDVERKRVVFGGGSLANGNMFLLAGHDFPQDAVSLAAAVGGGLAPLGLSGDRVVVEGTWPAPGLLRCDLSGAVFRSEHRAAAVEGELTSGFFVRKVEAFARPARFAELEFVVSLTMDDAVFAFGRDLSGQAVLVLERCGSGVLEVEVRRDNVERVVAALATKAAEEQGADVKSVAVRWEQRGPRALGVAVDARAKAMFVETGIKANGLVSVDDSMALQVSGLACSGEGMMGNLAATFLRKEIPKYEGWTFPLAGALPGLRVRDVSLRCEGDSLRVRAVV